MNVPRRRWWLLLICCLGLLLLLAGWWFGCRQEGSYVCWEEIGPVQVLGGPDEAWLFVEREIRVHRPGWLVEPPVITMARSQEVIIITPTEPKKRIPIPGLKGPTVHPNIGRIFRDRDGFYLVQGQSMGFHRSIFRWQDDHFDLLPLEESESLLTAYGLGSSKLPQFDLAIDRMTESNGWKALYRDGAHFFVKEDPFTWKDRHFQFKVETDSSAIRYRLCCTEPGERWDVILIAVSTTTKEITQKEYDELTDLSTPGHRSK